MDSPNNEFSVPDFLEQEWLSRQMHYLTQLLSSSSSHNQSDEEMKSLIANVMGHYQQYYAAKSRAAREDVFSLFAPKWFSTYERTFLWITGFKPGLTFSLLRKSVTDLSESQAQRVLRLKAETRAKEKELNNELASIQESAAGTDLVEFSREVGRQLDGTTVEVNDVLEKVRERFEDLVQSADYLRMWTTRELLEVLTPLQSVKFLAAAGKFQLKIRALGKHRDAQR